jgi:hypothetical protein
MGDIGHSYVIDHICNALLISIGYRRVASTHQQFFFVPGRVSKVLLFYTSPRRTHIVRKFCYYDLTDKLGVQDALD